MILGKNFKLNAETIFDKEDYEIQDSDVIATCFGAKEKFLYSSDGKKTITQCGWTYKVYVQERDMMINISVEDNNCAIDPKQKGYSEVRFTNFWATFYVNSKGYLDLSCKADKAESVKSTTPQTI